MTPRDALRDVLRRWEPPAGPDGFEGLVAYALAELSGYTFRLARSGSQFGRDAATPRAPFAIAMEAKRYTDSVPLEALVGKATVAAFALADGIDAWILAATVEVSEPTQRTLEQVLDAEGISLLTLDWTDASLPPLAVLLAAAQGAVLPWAKTRLDPADHLLLENGLRDIALDPAFDVHRERLLTQLSPGLLGLDPFRQRNADWCEQRFRDRRQAQREFSQFLAPIEASARAAERSGVHAAIERAADVARQDADGDTMVAVLGGEGAGKSWAVAKWWLASQRRPILLLSIGRIADQLDANGEPLEMLARLAAHQEGRRDPSTVARWRRRMERWSEGGPSRDKFVLLLDGLNETSGKPWASILRTFMPAVKDLGGIVLVTCREGYWDREVALRLSFVVTERVVIGEYDDAEFAEVTRNHGVAVDDLPDRLNRFMRNPRICALALTLLPQLTGVQDLTVDRLLMEYWRARLRERGDMVGHDDRDFENLLIRHAREYRARPGIDFNRDEWRSRSGAARRGDGRNLSDDLSDIEEGRFFDSRRGVYSFRPEALHFALGLLVADELRTTLTADAGTPGETLESVIDGVRGFDAVADILTAAIAVATLDADYPDRGITALVAGLMSLQNLADEVFDGLVPYIAARPDPFLDAYEWRDLDRDDGRFLQLLLGASRQETVARALDARMDRWLGSWSRAPAEWGDPGELPRLRQQRAARIDAGLAELRDEERAYFAANCAELPNAAGLAEAAALHLLDNRQAAFARGIVAFAFAHAIAGDHRSPFDEVAWVVRLNRVDHAELTAKVREEMAPFVGPGASCTARAAMARALRLLGSLKEQVDGDLLSPPQVARPPLRDQFEDDPLDPSMNGHGSLGVGVARLKDIDPAALWNHMSRTGEDHELDRALNTLARFDPDRLISFLNRVAKTVASRDKLALRQLGWRLPWLSPILDADAVTAIMRRIVEVVRDPSLVSPEDLDFVTGMMVESVLPHLDAEAQLDLLQSLPPEAPFYHRYSGLAKPLSAGAAERRLGDVASAGPFMLERTLLFLAAAPGGLTDTMRTRVVSCLASDEQAVRTAGTELARRHGDAVLDDAVLALPLPDGDDRSWDAAVVKSAFAGAVARRGRDDLVSHVPLEHLDWVAARLPSARARLAETIQRTIDRLARPFPLEEPDDAIIVLQVGDDPAETMVDLVDKGERFDDPIAELHAQLGDQSGARFARRRQLLREQLESFLDSLSSEGALTVARRPHAIGLAELARYEPDRFAGWLRAILAIHDRPVLRRRLHNLGLALAQGAMGIDPELVAGMITHLWQIDPHVTVQFGRARHPIRDLALFAAPFSDKVDELRCRALEEARNDGRIETLVLAAEAAGAGSWLDAFVDSRASSTLPADQALALTAAAFRPANAQTEELLRRDWPRGFLGAAAAAGRKRYREMVHAAHWFELAGEASDRREWWRLMELGIAAADRRQLLALDLKSATLLHENGGDVSQRLNKSAERASENARKTLFGVKKPSGFLGFLTEP